MRPKGTSYFLMSIIVLMIFVIGLSLNFRYFEAKVLPLLICIVVIVLAGLELKKELRTGDETQERPQVVPQEGHNTKVELRRFSLTLCWVVGLSVASYLFGMLMAISVFVFSYLKVYGRSWLMSISFAAVLIAFIYAIFELGLKVHLYPGIIFEGR